MTDNLHMRFIGGPLDGAGSLWSAAPRGTHTVCVLFGKRHIYDYELEKLGQTIVGVIARYKGVRNELSA